MQSTSTQATAPVDSTLRNTITPHAPSSKFQAPSGPTALLAWCAQAGLPEIIITQPEARGPRNEISLQVEEEVDDGGTGISVDARGEQVQEYEPGWSTADIEDPNLRAEIELILSKTPGEIDAEISELNARLNKLHAMKETRRRLTSKGTKVRRPAFVHEIMGKKQRKEKTEGHVSRRLKIRNKKAAKAQSTTSPGDSEEVGSQAHVQLAAESLNI